MTQKGPSQLDLDVSLHHALASEGPEFAGAQRELLRLLKAGLRRALMARPEALEWVDDFSQEAATRILRDLPHFRGTSRFSTWALAIGLRVAFDELRRKRWKDSSLDQLLTQGKDLAVENAASNEAEMTRRQVLHALQWAVNKRLTERQRTALQAELKGMPQSELGRLLGGVTRNAIYKLTHDARKQLKAALTEKGITAETIAWAFERKSIGGAK